MQSGKKSLFSVGESMCSLFNLLNDENLCMQRKLANLHLSCAHSNSDSMFDIFILCKKRFCNCALLLGLLLPSFKRSVN